MSKSSTNIFKITLTAVLSAAAFVLMFIEFPVPVMPAFIKFDVSDLPALFGAFALGPVYGVIIELIKNILHIVIKGTTSAFVGELSNFLLGASFVLVAGLIYKKNKTLKGAVIASLAGAAVMGIICLPLNYFVVYPAYVKFYHLPLEAIIGMYKEILSPVAEVPTSNALFNCLLIFNVPFTFIKGVIDAIICIAAYKPLSKLMKGKI
ncbi:MAG: ECF transporter S component [Clostridia bacterium]|nr:ECF transporter S component [Clostridia bacterium]